MKSNTKPTLPPALRKSAANAAASKGPAPAPDISADFPPIVAAIPKPALAPTPAKPAINTRIANLEGRVSVFAGTFLPEGSDIFEVETPLTGDPVADKQSLVALARKKFPKARLQLKSTRIFTKEIGTPEAFPKGCCIGQLFGEAGSNTEAGLEIGSVFWGGERCQIFLVNLRSRSAVTVSLRPPGGGKVAFSNHLAANLPAENLKSIVREVLGGDIRELEITLRVEK